MMQIRELVLYGYNGKVRHLPFALGKVNIITGRSKSGKSAIGDIIDYCMGGDSCNIADGIVRDNVAWYGLLLQFDNERIFVARKNPDKGQQTTSTSYIEIGEEIEVPESCDFISNTNSSGIEKTLTQRIGISENLNTPTEGQSRLPLAANIRHALYYCFQGQDEIAAKNFLFHRQSDDFVTQAIKDTIPYFLGAINEEALALENERAVLKRRLTIERRRLEENRHLMGGGFERAVKLIGEARQVGLIDSSTQVDYQNYQEVFSLLQDTLNWSPQMVSSGSGMDRLTFLQSKLQEARNEYDEIGVSLDNARKFVGEASGYSSEAQHQKVRLESIGLIAYFALQHYFIGAKRPVPRFMFLDQPSQVYFPSEFDEKKTDWNEVNKIYQFVIDRTTELQGQLQVIIVDHADLKKDSFREFIRENWWPDDKNLVPIDWYKSE